MNIALPRTGTGRKAPVVGVVLAGTVLGIAAGLGIWQISDSGSGPASPVAISTLSGHDWATRDDRSLLLYLVDSDAQADMVMAGEQEAANERASANMPDPGYSLLVLKATTPAEEANIGEVLEAWSANAGGVRINDLRGR